MICRSPSLLLLILCYQGSHAMTTGERVSLGMRQGHLRSRNLESDDVSVHRSRKLNERRMSSLQDTQPDFAPPAGERPFVNYGGRHSFENAAHNTSCYSPLRVALATHHLEALNSTAPEHSARISALVDHILPAMSAIWSEALSVIPVVGNLFHNQTTCGGAAVPNSFHTEGVADSDLILYVVGQLSGESGCDGNTLAYAGPCEYDQHMRPIAGRVVVCIDKIELDSRDEVPSSELKFHTDVLVHEMAHVLGMTPGMMKHFRSPETGLEWGYTFRTNVSCVDGSTQDIEVPSILNQGSTVNGNPFFEVSSPTVLQVARNQFDCQSLTGARLENQPSTPTCFGYQWDERLFFNERLSSKPLSPLTLALLEDSSWYKADFTKAMNSPFGHGAGCEFVESSCINHDGSVPYHSKGFFCNDVLPFLEPNVADASKVIYGCDPSHSRKAVCDLIDYGDPILELDSTQLPPAGYQHFQQQPDQGAYYLTSADYCPIKRLFAADCTDVTKTTAFAGESYGPNSKCFETTTQNSICLEMTCNEVDHRVDVMIGGQSIPCLYDGQMVNFTGASPSFQIECPKLAAVCPSLICPSNCAGRGVCDYTLEKPQCICNDPNDKSSGCWGNFTSCLSPPSPRSISNGQSSGGLAVDAFSADSFPSAMPTSSRAPSFSPAPTREPIGIPTTSFVRIAQPTREITAATNPPRTANKYNCGTENPCSPLVTTGKHFYASEDAHSFIQCGQHGQCSMMACPQNLVWNDQHNTCDFPNGNSFTGHERSHFESSPQSSLVSLSATATSSTAPPNDISSSLAEPASTTSTQNPFEYTIEAWQDTPTKMFITTPSSDISTTPAEPTDTRSTQIPFESTVEVGPVTLKRIPNEIKNTGPTENDVDTGECHADWDDLKESIEDSVSGGTFILCSNSHMIVDARSPAINIPPESTVIVKCGQSGKRSENCTLTGGNSHFMLDLSSSHMSIYGVTMKGASETSVLAWGGDGATATFMDCLWEGNQGEFGAAVDVYTRGNTAMEAVFIRCSFIGNDSTYGAVNIEAGTVLFDQCHFIKNTSTDHFSGSAITNRMVPRLKGNLEIALTCFIENGTQNGQGTVFVADESVDLFTMTENKGEMNVVGQGSCNGIFEEDGDKCTLFI